MRPKRFAQKHSFINFIFIKINFDQNQFINTTFVKSHHLPLRAEFFETKLLHRIKIADTIWSAARISSATSIYMKDFYGSVVLFSIDIDIYGSVVLCCCSTISAC
jgi:hypothetical protein